MKMCGVALAVFAGLAVPVLGGGRLPHHDPDLPKRAADVRVQPYAIRLGAAKTTPSTGVVRAQPEYAPMAGVLFQYDRFGWPDVVTEMVAALTGDPGGDEKAFVVVSTTGQRDHARAAFEDAGADLDRVEFVIAPTDSIWIRDYGPQFAWLDGTRAVLDHRYYASRPLDNFIPTLLGGDWLRAPVYGTGLFHPGGNFLAAEDGHGFAASIVTGHNQDFGPQRVAELFRTFHGIETLHVLPTLPSAVDLTGHLDMWFQLVDRDTVVIAEFLTGSNASAIAITNEAARYMAEDLGYEVFRVPALNGPHPDAANTHFSYTNAFRVNEQIFIPAYGRGGAAHAARDAQALAVWQQAAPDATIVPIDAWELIYAAGALHCISMQIPRRVEPDPAASVLSPAGGEFLVPGEPHAIRWSATDDGTVASADLYYSGDGGATFSPIALGQPAFLPYPWLVPQELGDQGRLRVVVHDDEARSATATSQGEFAIADAARRVYDFAAGAGSLHRAYGHQAQSWAAVANARMPPGASTELSTTDYADLAIADAAGGDNDGNRYRSPVPTTGWFSTHVVEFTIEEDPALLLELAFDWEGYGDFCYQVELYAWDHVAGAWCDGAGNCGAKHFLDNTAGNRDMHLAGFIRGGFERYVDDQGRVTFLLHTAPPNQATFHDYAALTVTSVNDADRDHVSDAQDCAPADAAAWALPGEVPGLDLSVVAGTTQLEWSAPVEPGGSGVLYDLLVADGLPDFTAALCPVRGLATHTTEDVSVAAPDQVRFYLVRATNACGAGSLGVTSASVPRLGDCP